MSHDLRSIIRQSPPIDVLQTYDPSTLENKTILITGAANGLGASMARHWAAHGAHLFIGDVDDAAGEAFVADLSRAHPSSVFHYQHCDVTDWDQQTSLFEAAVRLSPQGAIDVVVPNAGVLLPSESFAFENPPLVDGRVPRPSTVTLDVNIRGVIYTAHLALHHLRRNPASDTSLLLIGSAASVIPLPGQAQYTMAKHAVAGLFRTLRVTAAMGGRRNIRVNMLAPYFVAGSRMLPAVAEATLLSGGAGPARIPDVVDAATRLVADERIAGRSLIVGPPLRLAPEGEVPVGPAEGGGAGRAAWELYAHDYDEVDTFTYRYVRVLGLVARLRGSLAWMADLWSMLMRK
ncbi:short-chain dehydrogenase [Drechmeria coniospora]|uniref:Short-chain dehydrogenase n=1 Tax=Drechmeria coniospora TaxID=98403 RepID=A0A151GRX6_DRECN|nr:short-chain dehydrogenase [Drechmeria coniospora]KYK59865.1 short-chain dehydrogenase [Drechmeria coniospora]